MPIYVYRCTACGEESEFLLPMGASAPDACALCGARSSLRKQVTSAAFQLRGSGWYETDFKTDPPSNVVRSDDADSAAEGTAKDAAKDTSKEAAQDTVAKDTAKDQKESAARAGDSGAVPRSKTEGKKSPASESGAAAKPSPTSGSER